MELIDAVRTRRMTRAFERRPVPPELLERVLDAAARAPSAGNTQGLDLVVLEGDETSRYWDVTLPATRREGFPWPDLLAAPVLIIPVCDRGAYLERYSEPDKARSGLGEDAERWQVPYWYVDTAFAAMSALLAATDAGLGALFFGQFEHTDAVKAALAIPADRDPIGTIALGYAAAGDRPSRSAGRPRRPLSEIVHRGTW